MVDFQSDSSALPPRWDPVKYIKIRDAFPGDDLFITELLMKNQQRHLVGESKTLILRYEREIDLRDASSRRNNGLTRVAELGLQMVATYTLIAPGSALDDSWRPNFCLLRFQTADARFSSFGLAQRLLDDSIGIARKWFAEGLSLYLNSESGSVADLYRRLGFKRDRVGDRHYFGMPVAAFALEL